MLRDKNKILPRVLLQRLGSVFHVGLRYRLDFPDLFAHLLGMLDLN